MLRYISSLVLILVMSMAAYGAVSSFTIPNNTVSIGKTGVADKVIEMNLTKPGASTNPKQRFNSTTSKWEFSNNGTSFTELGASTGEVISGFPASLLAGVVAPLGDLSGGMVDLTSTPATQPPFNSNSIAISPDGIYMGVAQDNAPRIAIYKRAGDSFTKLADPGTVPASGNGRGMAFSPDGIYMALGTTTSPYIYIYKRSGDVFTKLADPATLPTGLVSDISFSPNGVYMAVAMNGSPALYVYKRAGDVFTKLADPAVTPGSTGLAVSFSPDSTYLVATGDVSPFAYFYKRSGDVFTKLADPSGTTGGGRVADWSRDGNYVMAGVSSAMNVYKRSGDTFTKLADPVSLPGSAMYFPKFSPDGSYIVSNLASFPRIITYSLINDVLTKMADPAVTPGGGGGGTSISPDGSYIAISGPGTPKVNIYKPPNKYPTYGKVPKILSYFP